MCSLNFQRIKCLYQKKQPLNQTERDSGFKSDEVVEISEKLTFSIDEVHKPEIQNLDSEMTNDGSTPISKW